MTEKKDLLEMDFGQVSVPQAIALTLQAATKCVTYTEDGRNAYDVHLKTDDDRLRDLMEKLETRVQDEIDVAAKAAIPVEVEVLDEVSVEWHDVVLMEDGELLNVKGAIFHKACNELVDSSNGPDETENTYCIKRWGHQDPRHEDIHGRTRD